MYNRYMYMSLAQLLHVIYTGIYITYHLQPLARLLHVVSVCVCALCACVIPLVYIYTVYTKYISSTTSRSVASCGFCICVCAFVCCVACVCVCVCVCYFFLAYPGWVANVLEPSIIENLQDIFRRGQDRIEPFDEDGRVQAYRMLGVDHMVDVNLNALFLEMNSRPGMGIRNECDTAFEVCDVVRALHLEWLDVVEEVFERRVAGRNFHNLESVETFKLIVDNS